jgi:hypothetical protein
VAEACWHTPLRIVGKGHGAVFLQIVVTGTFLMTTFRNLSEPFVDAKQFEATTLSFDYNTTCKLPNLL